MKNKAECLTNENVSGLKFELWKMPNEKFLSIAKNFDDRKIEKDETLICEMSDALKCHYQRIFRITGEYPVDSIYFVREDEKEFKQLERVDKIQAMPLKDQRSQLEMIFN